MGAAPYSAAEVDEVPNPSVVAHVAHSNAPAAAGSNKGSTTTVADEVVVAADSVGKTMTNRSATAILP